MRTALHNWLWAGKNRRALPAAQPNGAAGAWLGWSAAALRSGLSDEAELLGPAPRFRRRGRYRQRILVKTPMQTRETPAIRAAVEGKAVAADLKRGLTLAVDVDPQ